MHMCKLTPCHLQDGQTALHVAAHQNKLDIVRLLLERGADPSVCDKVALS